MNYLNIDKHGRHSISSEEKDPSRQDAPKENYKTFIYWICFREKSGKHLNIGGKCRRDKDT